MSQTRRLAAIMFTDIQDYSLIMQDNGVTTPGVKEKYRQIFETLILKFSGTNLQHYRGGTLSLFDSAIDAVHCAIDMQQSFSQDPKIPVRIGIHSGDIIFDQEEVIGDGVNVASRIESLAVGGSILVSDKVYDEIKNQKSIQTQTIGTYKLKNVDRPVEIYGISNQGLVIPSPEEIPGKRIKTGPIGSGLFKRGLGRVAIYGLIILMILAGGIFPLVQKPWEEAKYLEKSIAVLPLVNLSQDVEQEYFSDGITEDIISQLSNIGELRVISRTSSMMYKNTTKSTREIARELEVAHILEGSVRKYG